MKYTCPMHPEVIRFEPGSCPICGMDLEPMDVSDASEEEKKAYQYWATHFWLSLILTVPILVLSMGNLGYLGAQLVLATIVVVWGGNTFFVRAWQSIITFNLNMFTLIALGVGAAYLFSLAAVLLPNIFPEAIKRVGKIDVYFEVAAMIVTLVLLGQMLEARARGKTSQALRSLMKQTPKLARVIRGKEEVEISIEEVQVGDLLRVLPGTKVPVDGIVVEGLSYVDESMISGEPIPVKKQQGEHVIAGTMNQQGSFIMQAERVGRQTILAQIIKMVGEAQRSRAPIQKLADVVSGYFVPVVVLIALVTFTVWAIIGPDPRLAFALLSAVSVLIIACPCALGLATPLSIMVGVGRGAEIGILIKNAEALETLEKIDTLLIDKTGTLTEGKPRVTDIIIKENKNEKEFLLIVASVENSSEHPIAKAVLDIAKEKNIELISVQNFESVSGFGVKANVQNKRVFIGKKTFLQREKINIDDFYEKQFSKLTAEGKTVILVAINGILSGLVGITDPVKETTAQAIEELHALGLKIVILTGDNEKTAKVVADKLGIDEFHAEVNPEQKGEWAKKLISEGRKVAMAGDGVNDAVALTASDVGIAMGAGTDVAMECAGLTLVKGDLLSILKSIKLSRATMKNIRQNLFFAFIYNALGIPIAAGILFPLFGILLSPIIAGAAMSFSSVSVISNSLRLRKMKL